MFLRAARNFFPHHRSFVWRAGLLLGRRWLERTPTPQWEHLAWGSAPFYACQLEKEESNVFKKITFMTVCAHNLNEFQTTWFYSNTFSAWARLWCFWRINNWLRVRTLSLLIRKLSLNPVTLKWQEAAAFRRYNTKLLIVYLGIAEVSVSYKSDKSKYLSIL